MVEILRQKKIPSITDNSEFLVIRCLVQYEKVSAEDGYCNIFIRNYVSCYVSFPNATSIPNDGFNESKLYISLFEFSPNVDSGLQFVYIFKRSKYCNTSYDVLR